MSASDRVEWQPVDVAIGLGDGFGTVVSWPAQAVEPAAELVSSHTGSGGSASGEHGGRSTTDSCGSPEHLDDGKGAVEFEHLPFSCLTVSGVDLDQLAVPDAVHAGRDDERAGDPGHGAVADGERSMYFGVCHSSPICSVI